MYVMEYAKATGIVCEPGLSVLRIELYVAVVYKVSAARVKHSKQSGTKITLQL
jgi:hypothetical protein